MCLISIASSLVALACQKSYILKYLFASRINLEDERKETERRADLMCMRMGIWAHTGGSYMMMIRRLHEQGMCAKIESGSFTSAVLFRSFFAWGCNWMTTMCETRGEHWGILLPYSGLTDATLSTDDPSEWLTFLVSGASSPVFSLLQTNLLQTNPSRNDTRDRIPSPSSAEMTDSEEYRCVFPRCNISRRITIAWKRIREVMRMTSTYDNFANVIREDRQEGQQEMIFDPLERRRRREWDDHYVCIRWVKIINVIHRQKSFHWKSNDDSGVCRSMSYFRLETQKVVT